MPLSAHSYYSTESPSRKWAWRKLSRFIVSSFQALYDTASKSFHNRLHILERMARVHSYVMLLDLECDALVLDIVHHLLASTKDDHSPMMPAYIESMPILIGILTKADDLLLEFLVSILFRSQSMGSSVKKVLEAWASRIPLHKIISSIDEIMQIKENKAKKGHNDDEKWCM